MEGELHGCGERGTVQGGLGEKPRPEPMRAREITRIACKLEPAGHDVPDALGTEAAGQGTVGPADRAEQRAGADVRQNA